MWVQLGSGGNQDHDNDFLFMPRKKKFSGISLWFYGQKWGFRAFDGERLCVACARLQPCLPCVPFLGWLEGVRFFLKIAFVVCYFIKVRLKMGATVSAALCVARKHTSMCDVCGWVGGCICSREHVKPRPDSTFKLVKESETKRVTS